MRILVLNGVNLNVLGRRDSEIYGGISLGELESRIYQWARDVDSSAQCKQTNSEGEYVNWIHEALDWADGVIVNPAAWTHYSYAIRDALELFDAPIVEVHRVINAEAPGGIGEVGTAIAAPALANAIFAATGVRLYKLPVDRDLLVQSAEALKSVVSTAGNDGRDNA